MNFKKKLGELFSKYSEQISYLFFGGLTTIVSFITYFSFCSFEISPETSNILSFIISVTFAYITNRVFVFKSKEKGKSVFKEITSFFASRITSGVIETVIIYIFVTRLEYSNFWIKIIATIITVILNYIFSKLFVFKLKKTK